MLLNSHHRNVKYETTAHIISSESTIHRTFMDTLGRSSLKLTALNVVDEMRDREVIVSLCRPVSKPQLTNPGYVRLPFHCWIQEAARDLRFVIQRLWRSVGVEQARCDDWQEESVVYSICT